MNIPVLCLQVKFSAAVIKLEKLMVVVLYVWLLMQKVWRQSRDLELNFC